MRPTPCGRSKPAAAIASHGSSSKRRPRLACGAGAAAARSRASLQACVLAPHLKKRSFVMMNPLAERRIHWVLALTATVMVGEIVAGLALGSMAVLAEGWHMS